MPPNFKPGIAGYGWGIDGKVIKEPQAHQWVWVSMTSTHGSSTAAST
jgi:hypothetical protein